MDRWSGVLKVSLHPNGGAPHFRVAASLCLSSTSKTLTTPSANAIFFNGDQVKGTGNPVIDKQSDTQNIAEILVSKLGLSVNAWVVEASTYNGPFAVYKEFVPSVNLRGEPKCYNPDGFPASTSTMLLIAKCLEEAKNVIPGGQEEPSLAGIYSSSASCPHLPKTIILGFSKGGTVLNQLLTEFAHLKPKATEGPSTIMNLPMQDFPKICKQNNIIPISQDNFFNSISEFHYVDVGLNTAGAYLTDHSVVKKIAERLSHGSSGIRFALHGTPRQWCDSSRPWILHEKNRLLRLLEDEACKSGSKLQVCESVAVRNMEV